jgi:hypothetical protein
MSKMKIAIQGELGAYSHIAVEKLIKMQKLKPAQLLKTLSNKPIMIQLTKL